jgi:hypothetical protein
LSRVRDYDDLVSRDRSSAPVGLAMLGVALWIMGVACFAIDGRQFNRVGYVIGAWLVTIVALVYRRVDKRRSRGADYFPKVYLGRVITAVLTGGLIVAAVHAFFLAKEKRFQ